MKSKTKSELMVILIALITCFVLMAWLAMDAPGETEFRVMQYAQEHGISIQAYPECLIRLLEENPETEEFVLNYPFRQEMEVDLSNYDLTRGVPLLMQWDPRWGYLEYGADMVAVSGSGVMCLAMAGYYVTGDQVFYPDRLTEFARTYELDAPGRSSAEALISQGGEALGLRVKEVACAERKVAAYLQAGSPIIALMGSGDFTSSSQFVVLTAYRDGMLSVNDPGSYVNSGKQWRFEEIKGQIQALWLIQPGAEE